MSTRSQTRGTTSEHTKAELFININASIAMSPTVRGITSQLVSLLQHSHGTTLLSTACKYLTLARHGLTESELYHLLSLNDDTLVEVYEVQAETQIHGLPSMVFERLLHDLGTMLYRRVESQAELLAFSQSSFVEAVTTIMLACVDGCKKCHSEMAEFFSGRWAGVVKPYPSRFREVAIKKQAGVSMAIGLQHYAPPMPVVLFGGWCDDDRELILNERRLRELVYHFLHAGEAERARDELQSIEYIAAKFAIGAEPEFLWELNTCMQTASQTVSTLREVKSFVARWGSALRSPQYPWLAFQLASQEPDEAVLCLSALAARFKWRCPEKGDGVLTLPKKPASHQLSLPCRFTVQTHTCTVLALALSPDNTLLATAGCDTQVRVWDIEEACLSHVLRGHSRSVNAIGFSPDGRTLASASDDKSCILWDLTGSIVSGSSLKGAKSRMTCLAFSPVAPDGRTFLAAGSSHNLVMLWDAGSRCVVAAVKAASSADADIISVSFSPDGGTMAFSNSDSRMSIWRVRESPGDSNPSDSSCLPLQSRDLGKHCGSGRVASISFGKDGKQIMGVSVDGIVQTWRSGHNADDIWSPAGASDSGVKPCLSICSPDLSLVASAGWDGRTAVLMTWDCESRRQTGRMRTDDGQPVRSMVLGQDASMLATASEDGKLQVWDLVALTASRQRRVTGHQHPIVALAMSPDGKTVASGSFEHAAKIWCAESARLIGAFWSDIEAAGDSDGGHTVRSLSFSPDGALLAVANGDGAIRFWDMSQGCHAGDDLMHHLAVHDFAFHASGSVLATVDTAGTMRIWSMASRRMASPPVDLEACATCLHFGPSEDDITIALWHRDKNHASVLVWNWKQNRVVRDKSANSGRLRLLAQSLFARICSLSFNADCSVLCVACSDNSVSFWNVETQLETRAWAQRGSIARFVSASSVMVVSCEDVFIYELYSGRCVAFFRAPSTVSTAHVCGRNLSLGCETGELILLAFDALCI